MEKTIRNWLDRFTEEPIEQAPYDESRPGRPSKLDKHERKQFFERLQQSPTELGYEQQAWSPKLLLHHVKQEYGVEYSEGHARKLLGKPGCPAGQHGREITRLIQNKKPNFNKQSKKTAETDQQNRCCRRSVHQARRHSATTWLVPNRLKSNDRDIELLG
ncbi:helix-turn-helix domain-containing protein [Halomicrobium katesii]|uniref:helix-turn-helix domain-containing protein n=1 Tax=Halomicrobium katesii TaxID=437163 RepID=UPI001FE221D9|nr:helix-turn-helix domain-containing protein [Halomicrobium katesii]